MAKPSKKKTTKGKGKPTAKGTKAPAKKEPKKKAKREAVEAARAPVPSAGGHPNPLLVNKRNKRALCIAFAHETGGSEGTEEQDKLLMQAVRESGILWKSGMELSNFLNYKEGHIAQSEQSGRGYAMRCGRGRHDDYMENYSEKVEACLPFAKAFLKLIAKKPAAYETARQKEIDNIGVLAEKIAKQQEAEKAKKGKGKAKAKKPAKTPAKKKPAKVLKGKAKAKKPAKSTKTA
jgi:hypothetical protein